MFKVTVSGSFHRHMIGVYEAVASLRSLGVDVLSPADPRVVDHVGEFLFVASDKIRSVRLVQDRHFASIKNSDFLWVVCPDGYTGASTCLEIGLAHAFGVPVFAACKPTDLTVREYVEERKSLPDAISEIKKRKSEDNICRLDNKGLLLDPTASINEILESFERLKPALLGKTSDTSRDPERRLSETRLIIRNYMGVQ